MDTQMTVSDVLSIVEYAASVADMAVMPGEMQVTADITVEFKSLP